MTKAFNICRGERQIYWKYPFYIGQGVRFSDHIGKQGLKR